MTVTESVAATESVSESVSVTVSAARGSAMGAEPGSVLAQTQGHDATLTPAGPGRLLELVERPIGVEGWPIEIEQDRVLTPFEAQRFDPATLSSLGTSLSLEVEVWTGTSDGTNTCFPSM